MRFGSATPITLRCVSKNAVTVFVLFVSEKRYRALGLRDGDVIAWFWIGTHEEYNRFYF
jgi:hypothetical protein